MIDADVPKKKIEGYIYNIFKTTCHKGRPSLSAANANDRITIAAMKVTPLLFNKSRAAKTSWLSLGYEDDTPNGAFNTVFCHLRIMPQIFGVLTRSEKSKVWFPYP
ncbi:MAG TPA: hypothetical protein VHO90_12340 [Bacteroidales bacterium]|nr:hypothetical protein [Bacteroidales bacterium]